MVCVRLVTKKGKNLENPKFTERVVSNSNQNLLLKTRFLSEAELSIFRMFCTEKLTNFVPLSFCQNSTNRPNFLFCLKARLKYWNHFFYICIIQSRIKLTFSQEAHERYDISFLFSFCPNFKDSGISNQSKSKINLLKKNFSNLLFRYLNEFFIKWNNWNLFGKLNLSLPPEENVHQVLMIATSIIFQIKMCHASYFFVFF